MDTLHPLLQLLYYDVRLSLILPLVKGDGRIPPVLLGRPRATLFKRKVFPGLASGGATPVPIPNTVVKPSSADGTARETVWESRSTPGYFFKPALVFQSGFFCATGLKSISRIDLGIDPEQIL